MRSVGRHQELGGPVDHEADLAPTSEKILAPEWMIRMIQIPHEPAPRRRLHRSAAHDPVARERSADVRFYPAHPAVAYFDACSNVEIGGRRPGDEINGTANGISPVQRALRSAE